MSDFPNCAQIDEAGPDESLRCGRRPIRSARKLALIGALDTVGHRLAGSVKMDDSLAAPRARMH